MKYLGYREQYLFRLWQDYLKSYPMPQADRWLALQLKANKQFGKKDRQFYADAFFAGLRHALFAIFCLDFEAKKIDLNGDLVAWAASYFDPQALWQRIIKVDPGYFFTWVLLRSEHEITRNIDPYLQNVYQQLSQGFKENQLLLAKQIWHSLPLPYTEHLKRRAQAWSKTEFSDFLNFQDSKPPLWIRLRQSVLQDSVLAQLDKQHLKVLKIMPLQHTVAVAISGNKGIYELDSYKVGNIEIQDLASQMIGDALVWQGAKPMILDACAGGGGKTMQIASALNNNGAIYAMDIRDYKLDEIKRRAKKARFHNIRTQAFDWSLGLLPTFPKEVKNAQGFDCVLVDAPCSSSGTWRRNPDAKWRYDLQGLEQLNALQFEILQQTAKTVKPKGHLLYATCSFLYAENEAIVTKFLAKNENFLLVKMNLLGAPYQDSDTMFVAVLQKVS